MYTNVIKEHCGYLRARVRRLLLSAVVCALGVVCSTAVVDAQFQMPDAKEMSGIPRPTLLGWSTKGPVEFYFFCLGILALVSAATWWLVRSPWGRAFTALRENAIRADSLGVDTRRYTLMAFAFGSAIGGIAGVLYAPLVQFIEPTAFNLNLSLNLLLMVMVGGAGFFLGPFLGAAVSVLLPEWMRFGSEGLYLIFYAVAVMVLMAFCPSGLLGLGQRLFKR